jgi:Bacterial Ig-like domain (group 2)
MNLDDFFMTIKEWFRGILRLVRGPRRHAVKIQSTEAILAEFSDEVSRSSKLLDFLLSEGYLTHIPDQIIDDIEALNELVKQKKEPSTDERAKLKKAYRDLVTIPPTSVMFDGMPPILFWSFGSPWLWSLMIIGGLSTFAVLIMFSCFSIGQWWWPFACAFLSVLTIWGFYVFTGVVTNSKLNQIIRFCYIFTLLALCLSILPFWIPQLYSSSSPHKFNQPSDAPLSVLRGCADTRDGTGSGTSSDVPLEVQCSGGNQWVVNIGGVVEDSPDGQSYKVDGGMVVPLYVVVLALIGSAISMTRRVPEYQRRAMSAQDPLTNVEAREKLIFQIMQVLSAPLIAVTVYEISKPGSLATSVALGFGSGFASEPILLMIRGLVEKLSPAGSAPPPTVAVRVDPVRVTLAPGLTQQFTAKVTGSSNQQVTWQIDTPGPAVGTISQSGYYVAPGSVPANTITITAISTADKTKSASATVTIKT